MILLSGHSLTPARKVPLETMSLTMKERDATATITPADMTGISVGAWLLDDTEPGKGTVWRVRSITTAYGTDTSTVQLEHMINALKDSIIFGEIKAKDITGRPGATTCSAWQAANYAVSRSKDWVLYRFDGSGAEHAYRFDGDTLYDALETVSDSVADSWWTYDMTVYPFRLSIIKKPYDVTTEMRAGRNISTITRSIDRTGMYTRFYPIGKDDLNLPEQYVEKNTAAYGVVSRVDTDTTIDSVEELRRWANERLAAHAEPTVSIDIDGLELSASTGEPMDRIRLGNYCRVPLPEFGATITERIVQLVYQDKVNRPESVKVTLSNTKTDVTSILAESIKAGGRGGRAGAKQAKEDHAWFEDTDEHVAMCAIGIIGTDENGEPNWVRLSRLEVNEDGIYGEVKSVQGDMTVAQARLDINENAISAEVQRATSSEGTLSGKITVEAGKINQVVTAVGSNGKVTAASICLAINKAGSSATINANKIYLLGETIAQKVNAQYISSQISSVGNVTMQNATVNGGLTCFGRVTGNTVGAMTMELGGASFTNLIKSASVSGNVLTLTPLTGSAITFSKATALTGEWSSGVYTVTAKQNNTEVGTISTGSLTVASGQAWRDGDWLYVPVYAGTTATGYNAWVGWKNLLTSHSNATGGLHRYNSGSSTTMYVKLGDTYSSAGSHYWYYKDSNDSLTTYYS